MNHDNTLDLDLLSTVGEIEKPEESSKDATQLYGTTSLHCEPPHH